MDRETKRFIEPPQGGLPPACREAQPLSARLPSVSGAAPDSYRAILYLAGPLILSSTGYMLMQFCDALFLSWHSEAAVAAAVPSSMACFLALSLSMGVVNFASTFVAQYMGAGRPERAASAVWQGMYFGLLSGLAIAAVLTPASEALFAWTGHAPEIQALEVEYFRIVCAGAPLALVGGALSAFFTGRGDTRVFMAVQLLAVGLNAVLDYGLIFGAWGLPAWGMSGAAAATVASQLVALAVLGAIFFAPGHRRRFGTWAARGFDRELFARLVRYGVPNGVRFTLDILAWSLFLVFIGRVGARELAATSIAWRINGIAFFPLLGLSSAISILVGHAQGAGKTAQAVVCTRRGLALAEGWMLASAALFVLCPEWLFELFHDPATVPAENFALTRELGVAILRLVALYCLLDGVNLVLMGALQGAGDTRWTMGACLAINALFLAVLLALDAMRAGAIAIWVAATACVMLQALVWLARFASGHWKDKRVIEPQLDPELQPAAE